MTTDNTSDSSDTKDEGMSNKHVMLAMGGLWSSGTQITDMVHGNITIIHPNKSVAWKIAILASKHCGSCEIVPFGTSNWRVTLLNVNKNSYTWHGARKIIIAWMTDKSVIGVSGAKAFLKGLGVYSHLTSWQAKEVANFTVIAASTPDNSDSSDSDTSDIEE